MKLSQMAREVIREGSILLEALPEIQDDVDLIYDEYFKTTVDKVDTLGKIDESFLIKTQTDSSILKSSFSKKAHEINPVEIIINRHNLNFYRPSASIIGLGFNRQAIDFVTQNASGDIAIAARLLDESQRSSLMQEFTEHRIKGSIHHELLHWLDDTLNNSHIKKALMKAPSAASISKYYKVSNINYPPMEIQAQMGNISQLKGTLGSKWDTLTFRQMIDLSPSLSSLYKALNPNSRKIWLKKILLRMYREGLLGKSMKLS